MYRRGRERLQQPFQPARPAPGACVTCGTRVQTRVCCVLLALELTSHATSVHTCMHHAFPSPGLHGACAAVWGGGRGEQHPELLISPLSTPMGAALPQPRSWMPTR